MATFTETRHTGEHLVSEANGSRSRAEGELAAGNLPAGAVLALNGDGNYVQLAPGASDGTESAVGVLYASTNASDEAARCVIHVRDCEVHGEALTWPSGITETQKNTAITDLASAGIIVR